MNRPDEARSHLERSLTLDPALADGRCELGQLDLAEGRTAEASRELQAVLQQRPNHVKANIAMGDLLLKRGDLEAATARYQRAIQSDPESGPAHYKLSTVLMRLQDVASADREREIGAKLNAQGEKAGKTVLVLAEPDGTLLTGAPHKLGGGQ